MHRKLANRVLIVTGASSGIGAATAVEAARLGMRVVLAARREDRLNQIAQAVRDAGGEPLVVPTDIGDPGQVQRLIDRTVEAFGTIDVLFANAGFGYMAPLMEADERIERQMWDVNYFGTLHCIRAAVPVMIKQGSGHVMICSSIVSRSGLPYYGTYAATKGALHGMSASLELELAPLGIDVTGVYPAGTRSEFFDTVAGLSGGDGISENTPAIFIKSAEQVARRIVKGMKRPRPDLWPSFSSHFGATIWTAFPRLRSFCMSFHARWCRRTLKRCDTAAASAADSTSRPAR